MTRPAPLPALLVTLFFASTFAGVHAASPNESNTVLSMDDDVTALALGEDIGWIAAGMADPTTRTSIGEGGSIGPQDAEVWTWWNHLGSPFQSNDVDRAECHEPGNLDSCQTDVVDMAMSQDGKYLAVLGVDEAAEVGTLLLWDRNGVEAARITIGAHSNLPINDEPRLPRALAMSDDARHIVVVAEIPGVAGGETAVYKYTWDQAANSVTRDFVMQDESALDGAPTDVSISPDGRRISVGASPHVRILDSQAIPSKGISGQALSVAMSEDQTEYWSVAGFEGGEIALYSKASEIQGTTAVFSQRPVNNLEQRAVAIPDHGRWFAAGYEVGVVRLYANPLLVATVTPLIGSHSDLGGPVHAMDFSEDGRYLVVGAGDQVHFFRTGEKVFESYWSVDHDLDAGSAVRHVASNADGTLVAVSAGADIYQYTEVKGFETTLPTTTVRVSPQNQVTAEIQYENTGNREATVELSAIKPNADWTITFEESTLQVPPGETEPFRATIVAPGNALAGPQEVVFKFQVNGEDLGSTTLPIQVLQEQVWAMERVSSEVLSMDPGRSVSFAVNVTNLGNAVDSAQILADVDQEGWTVDVDPSDLELDPGATQLVTLRVTSPADAQEGDIARIETKVSVDEDAKTTFEALVGADFGVQFSITTPEDVTLFPGNTTTLRLQLSNPGNAVDSYRVETAGVPAGWTIRFPDDQNPHTVFSVLPGDAWEVPVEITAADGAEAGNYQVAFRATSLGDTSQSSVAKSVLVVEEPPVKPKGKDSPGFEAVALLALLGAIAVLLRRKR